MAEWAGLWGCPGGSPASPHEGHLCRNANTTRACVLPSHSRRHTRHLGGAFALGGRFAAIQPQDSGKALIA